MWRSERQLEGWHWQVTCDTAHHDGQLHGMGLGYPGMERELSFDSRNVSELLCWMFISRTRVSI